MHPCTNHRCRNSSLLLPDAGDSRRDTRLRATQDSGLNSRRGFTLIELLVAVAIFAILVSITLTALHESDNDRAAAGAQQLRSMLEGARSRAIHDGLPRGVRLLTDPNNPQIVTSLVYIGAPRQYRRKMLLGNIDDPSIPDNQEWGLLGPDFAPGDGGNDGDYGFWDPDPAVRSDDAIQATVQQGMSTIPFTPIWTIRDYGRWPNLFNRRLLQSTATFRGARIRIPADGHWFPIVDIQQGQTSGGTPRSYVEITLGGDFGAHFPTRRRENHIDASYTPEVYAAIGTGSPFTVTQPIEYLLELAPPMLAGSTPRPLANGIAIDLVGSKVPTSWGDPATHKDLMFTPRGDLVGDAAAAGILHFVVADMEEIANAVGDSTARYSDSRAPVLRHDNANQIGKPDRLVTVFTRTGLVLTSQVNHFDSTVSAYEFALQGRDAP